jgi:3-deoxy-D-manno-octulosonic-acid transferase
LVAELEAALGDGWNIVISTTTATGQALAKERFGAERVFFYPLDFAWAVRAYLRALRPRMLVLMEGELWPRMLVECGRAGIPVAVVNARVSDRSYARGVKVQAVWGQVLRRVNLFLAQSEEDARRLVAMGARSDAVRAIGNLKYDVRAPKASRVAELIREAAMGRPIIVAGSTAGAPTKADASEDEMLIGVWQHLPRTVPDWSRDREVEPLLVLAPRHPERFQEVRRAASGAAAESSASRMVEGTQTALGFGIITIDTIGDLAATYGVGDIAVVGGSLVKRGGHNPLEPAQFGVPVVMGPSFENFRDIVARMQAADAIRIVRDTVELQDVLVELLTDRDAAKAMGERGRKVFEAQSGATARAVEALAALVKQ